VKCSLVQALLERCVSSGGGDYAKLWPGNQEQDDAVEMMEKVLKSDMDQNLLLNLSP
jgi:hypothetical protein